MPGSIRYDCGVIFGPWFDSSTLSQAPDTGRQIKPCHEQQPPRQLEASSAKGAKCSMLKNRGIKHQKRPVSSQGSSAWSTVKKSVIGFLLIAPNMMAPGAMAIPAKGLATRQTKPQGGSRLSVNCNFQNQHTQRTQMFLLQSLETCNVKYGRCQGRLDAQCNVRLKDIGKTTVREFCKNEVVTNKTASTMICAPVNNLLSQSKQKQEQCEQKQEQRSSASRSRSSASRSRSSASRSRSSASRSRSRSRSSASRSRSSAGSSASRSRSSASRNNYREQLQEQEQKQQQKQQQSMGFGFGLFGAVAVAAGSLVGYFCRRLGMAKGYKQGFEKGMKQANKNQRQDKCQRKQQKQSLTSTQLLTDSDP